MKTKFNTVRLLFVTVALGALASFANAGPPQYGTSAIPVTTTKEAEAVKPDDTAVMVCGACKTVEVLDSKHVGPTGKGADVWFTIGAKHKCGHCGGEMSVVRGKTTDSMQHNCSMCGEGAAFCCVAPAPTYKK